MKLQRIKLHAAGRPSFGSQDFTPQIHTMIDKLHEAGLIEFSSNDFTLIKLQPDRAGYMFDDGGFYINDDEVYSVSLTDQGKTVFAFDNEETGDMWQYIVVE